MLDNGKESRVLRSEIIQRVDEGGRGKNNRCRTKRRRVLAKSSLKTKEKHQKSASVGPSASSSTRLNNAPRPICLSTTHQPNTSPKR